MSLCFGIVVFPGSNCDQDCRHVVEQVLGARSTMLWHKDRVPALAREVDVVILPGGFSYGDYLRAGALAQLSPVMQSVRDFAAAGRPVLGICNGFQVLCESRLLPGALARNTGLHFLCEDSWVRVETQRTPFSQNLALGQTLRMPIAHNEGRYLLDEEGLARLEGEAQVVFRYQQNPNGSVGDIAGVCNEAGNVVGLMPHPERAAEAELGSVDGRSLFESVLAHLA